MRRLAIVLALLIAIVWLLEHHASWRVAPEGAEATVVLGLAILAAHTLGLLLKPLGLPMVSAHLFLGMLVGPHVIGLISEESIDNLRLIDSIALALIALTAGGELVLAQLRALIRPIVSISLVQTILIFIIMAGLFRLIAPMVPFTQDLSERGLLAVCMLVGILAVAKSPATTIAIITETRSKGRMTDTVLGVTILKDVLVILAFAVVFSASEVLIDPRAEMRLFELGWIAVKLFFSVGAGLGLAFALALALPRVGRRLPILIAGTAILVAAAAGPLGLDPLMLCIAAGFVIRNFTTRGRDLVRGIESISPLVFAVFFTLAGADLNLVALRQMWVIASILVIVRLAAIWVSTWVGSRLAEDEPATRRWAWTGFISQAGVTLVLVSLVAVHFTEWGNAFKTLIVATIAVNQIIGPVAFKIGLVRAGEAGCQELPIKPGSVPLPARASSGPSLAPASD